MKQAAEWYGKATHRSRHCRCILAHWNSHSFWVDSWIVDASEDAAIPGRAQPDEARPAIETRTAKAAKAAMMMRFFMTSLHDSSA
jgi:hypothetical protein